MSRVEAVICALIVGLMMCLGLVLWVQAQEPEELPVLLAPVPVSALQADDPHEGQPEHCTNAKDAPKAHACDCKKAEQEDGGKGCDVEDVKCRVYCRKDKCYCFHPKCDS